MSSNSRFLMCVPDHYRVDYVINPWMEGNVQETSPRHVTRQWQLLSCAIHERARVELIRSEAGWPDMVFTANAGLVAGRTVVLSRFRHQERQGEEPFFRQWFEAQDYKVHELPVEVSFEGAGDALFQGDERWLWAGYGFRTTRDSHAYLARWLDVEVISLRLIDPRFYHLDTCLCPLSGGYLLYYPPAFSTYSNQLIEQRVPSSKRIPVGTADALAFACNAVNIGTDLILNQASNHLKQRLAQLGFHVMETPLTEFLKAGGAAKCLTLCLAEPSYSTEDVGCKQGYVCANSSRRHFLSSDHHER